MKRLLAALLMREAVARFLLDFEADADVKRRAARKVAAR
jgi:hypothetical protein